jgi:hypothetical protein
MTIMTVCTYIYVIIHHNVACSLLALAMRLEHNDVAQAPPLWVQALSGMMLAFAYAAEDKKRLHFFNRPTTTLRMYSNICALRDALGLIIWVQG